ncbi:MAG: glycosyltransferase, partial [Anaerolineae bacterium]
THPAGPAPGPVIVTAVGRLAPEKGPDLLLAALRILHEQEMAGESPAGALRVVFAGDGPLRSSLQAQAAAWGLAPYVEFSGAFDDLAPIMQRTDIVAHPTRNDGRSVSVLEAMAWAKPVVATRVGGLPELIEEGVNGLLTPPDDPAALAAALHRLAQDPDLRRRMGQAGRARFLAGDFTVAAMVKATLAVYRQVIAQKSAVGSHP